MKIFIPTLGRMDRQSTYAHIPDEWRDHTYVVCPTSEKKTHLKSGVHKVLCFDEKGIAPKRQFIIDECRKMGDNKALMLDDDFDFFFRGKKKNKESKTDFSFYECSEHHVNAMLDSVAEQLDSHVLVGIAPRAGSNRYTHKVELNVRCTGAVGYRVDSLHKIKARFDTMKLMEDMHVQISVLRAGLTCALVTDWAYNQSVGSNSAGGCSLFRTSALQTEAAHRLAKLHPGFVNVVQKKTKGKAGAMWSERTDVIVYWKKAYESSLL